MNSSPVTTHVLDLASGRPAAGIEVAIEALISSGRWQTLARGKTGADGRIARFTPSGFKIKRGSYRLLYKTGPYFRARKSRTFYPEIPVVFSVHDPGEHYHVPLLLSPFGYSTYRGS